jgi:DNA repair photolyase
MSRVLGWNSSSPDNVLFCSYPLKLEIAEGCPNLCAYCFVQDLKKGQQFLHFKLNRNVVQELDKAAQEGCWFMRRKIPFRMSTNTDPLCAAAVETKLTEQVLIWLDMHAHPVLIVTKCADLIESTLLEILKRMSERGLCAISMTFTTKDENLRQELEPRASSVEKRIDTIGILTENRIRVAARLQPLIPRLTDGSDQMRAAVDELKRVGVVHITAEYLKLEHFMWQRMVPLLRTFGIESFFRDLYAIPKGSSLSEKVVYWRAEASYRRAKLTQLAEICSASHLDFATCKEGLYNLHTTDDCCGAHLPNMVGPTAFELYRFTSEKRRITWNDVQKLPRNTPYFCDLQKFWLDGTLERKVASLKKQGSGKGTVYVLAD